MEISNSAGIGLIAAGASCLALVAARAGDLGADVTQWLGARVPAMQSYLDQNVSPNIEGYPAGFVIAAPWIVPGVQDYQFHWVRDSALVMNTYVSQIKDPSLGDPTAAFEKLREYANFSKQNQGAPEPAGSEHVGLGEVKFNRDGSRVTQWMRPQNDGPALRSITFTRLALQAIQAGNTELATHLYSGGNWRGSEGFSAPGVIAADLNYLVNHWNDPSFDPWEEVKGHHFYTRMVERKALRDGAMLAQALGDLSSVNTYLRVANQIERAIDTHWIAQGAQTPRGEQSHGQIWDSFDVVYGIDYKSTGLDSSTVLAVLHAHNELDTADDHFYTASNDRVLRTAFALARAFSEEYPLASARTPRAEVGTPIGRYPRDKYNGFDSKHAGNPWFLTTAAFAELYYRCAKEWEQAGEIVVTDNNLEFLSTLIADRMQAGESILSSDPRMNFLVKAIRNLGDSYLRRVQLHEGSDGHLTEEYSRINGIEQGAIDLSWSYAAVLTAAQARAE